MSVETQLEAIKDDIDTIRSMAELGVPPGATLMVDVNAAAVALAASPQVINAAPGAGKRHVIRKVIFSNPTNAEIAVLKLQDTTGTPVILAGPFMVGDSAVSGQGILEVVFNPPLYNTVNKDLDVCCVGNLGDSFAHVQGWIETVE